MRQNSIKSKAREIRKRNKGFNYVEITFRRRPKRLWSVSSQPGSRRCKLLRQSQQITQIKSMFMVAFLIKVLISNLIGIDASRNFGRLLLESTKSRSDSDNRNRKSSNAFSYELRHKLFIEMYLKWAIMALKLNQLTFRLLLKLICQHWRVGAKD